ncbi:hypothetical protein GCM10023220_49810 [Streptomyces ziwulingensis]|uniref:Uncharacterized protein n=1 Tax=Streptomyces ziwulingensis TaxID=1045501 RepID=A0ABP9CQX4_9ACTN
MGGPRRPGSTATVTQRQCATVGDSDKPGRSPGPAAAPAPPGGETGEYGRFTHIGTPNLNVTAVTLISSRVF